MAKKPVAQVVTANALLEGCVVYQTAGGTWSTKLAEAEVLLDEAEAQLRLLSAMAQSGTVVGAYLAEVDASSATPKPTHFREAFRRDGPGAYAFPRA